MSTTRSFMLCFLRFPVHPTNLPPPSLPRQAIEGTHEADTGVLYDSIFDTPSPPAPLPQRERGEKNSRQYLVFALPSPLWGRGAGGEGVSKIKRYSTLVLAAAC